MKSIKKQVSLSQNGVSGNSHWLMYIYVNMNKGDIYKQVLALTYQLFTFMVHACNYTKSIKRFCFWQTFRF